MLTADLVRAHVRSRQVYPRYIDADDEGLLEEGAALVALFQGAVGETMGALEAAIVHHIGDDRDFLFRRGLVKLLQDRTEVATEAPADPMEVRRVVFEEAAIVWPVCQEVDPRGTSRKAVLAKAAETLGITPEQIEAALYADLRSAQQVTAFEPQEPQALLNRYNLALAQGVLLRAREVVVELEDPRPARVRQLLRIVKFHRLMHRAERVPGKKKKERLRITLDGPLSLFRQTQRYGLQLACFLPALIHCDRWSLEAELAWGQARFEAIFKVDHKAGLVSHTRDQAVWESKEERHLRATWKKLDTPWALKRSTRVVDLGGKGVMVPDYLLVHPDGRQAYLELVWFWKKQTFKRRLDLLRQEGPPNLIVALATRLNAGEEGLDDLPGAIYPFKGVIQPRRLVELAEAHGQ